MIERIVTFSVKNKLLVFLLIASIIGFGTFSLLNLPIGALPDVTNNQVQVITTSRNLSTEDVEKFITYPVEIEMANLPGVEEIRSVSKFGLSVVTVVFEEDMDTYLPRQLISEKLLAAQKNIPANFGTPFMGPVTTGLGEIYQYTLEVDEAHKDEYSLTDLRTIQDWVVKRQLSGIPGVVEVNTWGGYLKQYEVSINPIQMRAVNVTLEEVFAAIEKTNSVAGGGYIERDNEAVFIRGEGMTTTAEEIESTVVCLRNDQPVYVRDIAEVKLGHATRFGAITGNGEGEKVMGQVMMLKGADSKQVIEAVHKRVADIQSTLPEGIRINGFLERSELVHKTTFTISENLILGSLIVIFVVVLLIGNIRSGLIIASVIPLSLLFALSLMYVFHVDANLMSLGAIDFGIIIDGAVIIVEFTVTRIAMKSAALRSQNMLERRAEIDQITIDSTNKMMRSAIFGQLIIIIVFIPILALTNIEGKMFRPMALVFIFALTGAMILGMTYVPVISSMLASVKEKKRRNISDRLIGFIQRIYKPVINWALSFKAIVLSAAGVLLVVAIFLFSRMGGEFIPTLDEGDFVIQPIIKTGTSLEKTVEMTTQMEKILMEFPEVEQIVSRIGAAEVPTDPMSMEESDVIIKLRPKSEWTSAETKDELAEMFKSALSVIPGVDYEFTQPIEMRFNELITGVRADVAIKIFGEDLGILYQKANEIEKAISHVEGAADISVEKIDGLPQMTVEYDRPMIAKYGLSVAELNEIITIAFAGKTAGTVFEGEKRFDLVVRYDEAFRSQVEELERLIITTPTGDHLPFSEFANISMKKGPAKISRDDTKRRVVIGVNVRNRDLESVVEDIQKIIDSEITLPTGYNIEYGGQFKNLRAAKARLVIAVPIALVLIFILLYMAFKSVKEALIIYSAIPLSAVGGVLFLWLRDLPFSVSAGVGFIALFGIAVLNGIVLIEHFKELKHQGMSDIHQRVIAGTKDRIRPVLLTASAAALGFLPMAVSTSAGAEVQRPLATVVVGGLITATLLTLVVLPVLYAIFEQREERRKMKINVNAVIIVGLFAAVPATSNAQSHAEELNQFVEVALNNNPGIKAYELRVEQKSYNEKTAFDLEKANVYYNFDQNNIAPNNFPLQVVGISQKIEFPSIFVARKRSLNSETNTANLLLELKKMEVMHAVSKAYIQLLYLRSVKQQLVYLDSVYSSYASIAGKRFELGETNQLEFLSAQSKQKAVNIDLSNTDLGLSSAELNLQQLLFFDSLITVTQDSLPLIIATPLDTANHPGVLYQRSFIRQAEMNKKLSNSQMLPDFDITYFQGRNNGLAPNLYHGIQFGLSVPLYYGAQHARSKVLKTEVLIQEKEVEDYTSKLLLSYQRLISELNQVDASLSYYDAAGRQLSNEIIQNALISYTAGEIDYLQFTQLIDTAYTIEKEHITNLYKRNLLALEINFLI